jgi:TPR repeat protein
MYMDGRGVQQSDKEAAKWFTLAAEQGVTTAHNDLGNL